MIINMSQLREHYDIVIIRAGISGLALSQLLKLEDRKILLVESGDFKFNKEINQYSYAKANNLGNWPSENYASYYSRVRMFGGNGNVWGGWCMELDEHDFTHNSTWNILKADLKIHYKKAYELLNIIPHNIDPEELNMKSIHPYSINIQRGNYIKNSREYLEKSENIDVLIKTKLINMNLDKNKISSIVLENLDGNTNKVKLKKLILAAGGIETTRMLLNYLPYENLNHNLGKYFMEHLQIQVGRVSIKNPLINKFIKIYSPPTVKHLFDDKLGEMDAKYFSGFQPTNQEVRNYFVLRNSNVYQSKSLYRLRHIILTRNLTSTGSIKIKDLLSLVIDVLDMFVIKFKSAFTKNKSYSVVLHLEQKPDEGNQIYIDSDNTTILDWNITNEDFVNLKNSIKNLNIIFSEMKSDFELNDIFKSDEKKLKNYLEKNIFGIGHHMGTTKMGQNENDSVCDLSQRYHGIDNLIINSTSVFPTGGIANPTLTMLALTSRLAEKLNNE